MSGPGHAHLDPLAHEAIQLPQAERIRFACTRHFVPYTRADEALQLLSDLLDYPRALRMPNLLVVGDSGNGKSTLLEHFRRLHPVQPSGGVSAPVIGFDMPTDPTETRFWSEALSAMHIAHRVTDPVQAKKNQVHSVLSYLGCRMLIIDEFHNVLHGNARQQRQFLALLKNLSNELRLPIIVAGTRDTIRTLHTDPQLSSRFEAFGLPRWKLDREFLRLLASFERLLPLEEPSELAGREMANRLHAMSQGTIGGVARVLERATMLAIRRGARRIDLPLLSRVSLVKLSDYGKQAEAL